MKFILAFLFFLVSLTPTQAKAAKILFFGDSHSVATVAPFGLRMNKLLRALPKAEVITHARCGSTIDWWYSGKSTSCGYFDQESKGASFPPYPAANQKWAVTAPTPKIIPMIEIFKPDLLVIEMGANYMYAPDPTESIKQEIGKFISDIEKIKVTKSLKIDCVWIGPPANRDHMDGIPPLVKAIRETVEPTCSFIDSTTMTKFPLHAQDGGVLHGGKDGIHYSFREGIPIATAWANSAFLTIKTHYEKNTK